MKRGGCRRYFFVLCLSVMLITTPARGVVIEQEGLEIGIRELVRDMKGVMSFELFCRNTSTSNKTMTGTIRVYNAEASQKIGDAVVFIEIGKNSISTDQFHAFFPANIPPGKWELEIDRIYDFILADLEADLAPPDMAITTGETEAAGSVDAAPDAAPGASRLQTPEITGSWTFSGDPRWSWEFSASGSLQIIQRQETDRLLIPSAFGTYIYQAGILTITFDDLCEWPERFEIVGTNLAAGDYVLIRK